MNGACKREQLSGWDLADWNERRCLLDASDQGHRSPAPPAPTTRGGGPPNPEANHRPEAAPRTFVVGDVGRAGPEVPRLLF
eukprot:4956845-Alexandrium_andersonii.AAC.1